MKERRWVEEINTFYQGLGYLGCENGQLEGRVGQSTMSTSFKYCWYWDFHGWFKRYGDGVC